LDRPVFVGKACPVVGQVGLFLACLTEGRFDNLMAINKNPEFEELNGV